MDLVTSVIAVRNNNKNYFNDSSSMEQNLSATGNKIGIAENVYYINEGIFGSFANILYEKATYCVTSLSKTSKDSFQNEEKLVCSSVYGPTCDSSDCLSELVDLPVLEIGDHLLIYHVGAYSSSFTTKFNGFRTEKYFFVWKD
jgi:diaminopimelate decarboxylase